MIHTQVQLSRMMTTKVYYIWLSCTFCACANHTRIHSLVDEIFFKDTMSCSSCIVTPVTMLSILWTKRLFVNMQEHYMNWWKWSSAWCKLWTHLFVRVLGINSTPTQVIILSIIYFSVVIVLGMLLIFLYGLYYHTSVSKCIFFNLIFTCLKWYF